MERDKDGGREWRVHTNFFHNVSPPKNLIFQLFFSAGSRNQSSKFLEVLETIGFWLGRCVCDGGGGWVNEI